MMIKIDAIVREEKFEDVKAALNAIRSTVLRYRRLWAVVCREDIRKSSGVWKWQCRCFRKSNLKS